MGIKHNKLKFEYSKITDHIYLGTNMCCQTHFSNSLLKRGIKADISLEKEHIDKPIGVEFFLWLPTEDHKAPSLKQLNAGIAFIDNMIEQKVKCYVHCLRGHGRSPTLVAAYLISKGMSVGQSINFIKKKRTSIHLNQKQINQLKLFKDKTKINSHQ